MDNPRAADERLEANQRSWTSEEDFQWLADNGIKAVGIQAEYSVAERRRAVYIGTELTGLGDAGSKKIRHTDQ